MRTLDEITTAVRRAEPATTEELTLAVCAYDVLLSKLKVENNPVQLQEYFVAGDTDPAAYIGPENDPNNPWVVHWHKTMIGEPRMINYNQLAMKIYEQNKAVGWWDDPDRCIFQTLQLVSTEIAEATEGERKDLMDDHITTRKMGEVELADALIRILDLGGRYGWEVIEGTSPLMECTSPGLSIGGKHLFLNVCLVGLTHSLPDNYEKPDAGTNYHYTNLVISIVAVAESQGYDIEGAMFEKLEYNQKRQDHKRENRAKVGGKAF